MTGNGNGTFEQGIDYPTDPGQSGALIDLNHDGKLDAVVTGTSRVNVLLGKGDGTFPITPKKSVGIMPSAIITADVNRDGLPDVLTANNSGSSISVLLNNGDGTLTTSKRYATGATPYAVVAADVNRDGQIDLVVSHTGDMVGILLGNGDGTFGAESEYSTGISTTGVVVADVDGDGKPDIISSNIGPDDSDGNHGLLSTISVLLGRGDGSFESKTDYPAAGAGIAAGDINNDGRIDLVVASSFGGVSVMFGAGDGTFSSEPLTQPTELPHLSYSPT